MMKKKYQHDLEYLWDLYDGLENTKDILLYVIHEKTSECIYYSYDDEAFEINCNHPNILGEIDDKTGCRHCPYYETEAFILGGEKS